MGMERRDPVTLAPFPVICAWCGVQRTGDTWHPASFAVDLHGTPTVTHGICPECSGEEPSEAGLFRHYGGNR
jgi:hypothetical protein